MYAIDMAARLRYAHPALRLGGETIMYQHSKWASHWGPDTLT